MTVRNNRSGDSILMVITVSQIIVVSIILIMTVYNNRSGDSSVVIVVATSHIVVVLIILVMTT